MPTVISREPSLWIGFIGGVLNLLVLSGLVPVLSDNKALSATVITVIVGALIRFFVKPVPAAEIGL